MSIEVVKQYLLPFLANSNKTFRAGQIIANK
jgi:hypothetical protein